MRTILILDTETTGLDPTKDACIEVGCILYSLAHKAPTVTYASLIQAGENAAEAVNHIPAELLRGAAPPGLVWGTVRHFVEQADAIVAHRAEFDRAFVRADVRDAKPWICSKFDIEWPHAKMGEHLVHLALAHDVGVISAHRAITDCDTLMRVFQRVAFEGVDVAQLLVRAMRPKKRFVADVSYEDREKAKGAGFAWDPDRRQWYRTMPPEDTATLPFPTREVA